MRFGVPSLLLATLVAQSSQPTFRSRIDLLRVDVTVMDKSGAPITDLAAGDFLVTVDGQPSVYLPVMKQGGDTNTIAVVDGVRDLVSRLVDVPKELTPAPPAQSPLFPTR